MTDMLYILGNGSKHDNQELRWSLRSLEKYGRNIGSVSVVGDVPDWLSPEVNTLHTDNHANLVQKNIFANVKAAVDAELVDGRFILQADDHFYVKDVDFDAHPTYVSGELPTTVAPDEVHYEYKLGLVGSRWILGAHGLPTFMTSNHNALTVDACSLYRHRKIVQECGREESRMNAWVVLGNMFLYDNPDAPIGKRKDIKLCEPVGEDEFTKVVGGTDMFSIDNGMFECEAFIAFMEREFPNKCRWEK